LTLLAFLLLGYQSARAETTVVAHHPRILLQADDLAGLRQRCKNDPYLKPVYEKMRTFAYGNNRNTNLWVTPDELCSIALTCLIEDRDPKLLARAIDHIDYLRTAKGDSWTRPRVLKSLACAYDWLHGDLSAEQRRKMVERMVELAEQMREQYRHSDYNNHVYLERGPILYFGLALAGDGLADAEAKKALTEAEGLLRRHFVPTINQVGFHGDGGWHESMSYWSFFAYEFAHQLEAWRTATGENLFAECPALAGAAQWLVHCTRPHDRTMAPVADIESPVHWGDQESACMPLIAARYKNGLAQWVAQQTPPQYGFNAWSCLLAYDPGVAPVDVSSLPSGSLFSGIGWAAMRSDWTGNATWALFTCGDYYAGHQHFDQNSFIISKQGNLAIDAGEYGAKDTLFHNTILIGSGQRPYGNDPRTRFGVTPPRSEFDTGEILAFEVNKHFSYVAGDASNAYGRFHDGRRTRKAPIFLRRLVFLKPDTFVIDDLVRVAEPGDEVRWLLHSHNEPVISDTEILIEDGQAQLACRTVLPERAKIFSTRDSGGRKSRQHYRIEISPDGDDVREVRFVHVLHARSLGSPDSKAHCEPASVGDDLLLSIEASGRIYRLLLPPELPGRIAVESTDGNVLLPGRPLPAGILPYTAEGVGLLQRWDSSYRRDDSPGWDTGRPSSNLQKALSDGLVKPCRAAELGCGTGTNVIYLAQQGFDVTGIDIAPTALNLARAKAEKAGVKADWLLADVTRAPQLKPFDFIFDRGCYHGVRRTNAAGYVATLRQLTHRGSRVLVLAGNANEERHYGPPRVKEEEIRSDFSNDFRIVELRETRFDTQQTGGEGALAWFILLERK
jgi:SAM-dependent methyltransferase